MTARRQDPPAEGSAAEGREIVYWIAKAAEQIRTEAKVEAEGVAHLASMHPRTITRFENLETFPEQLDEVAAAYAIACGLEDERIIYRRAVELWYEKGSSALPTSRAAQTATSYAQRFAQTFAGGAQRERQQALDGKAETSKPTRKKRAGG